MAGTLPSRMRLPLLVAHIAFGIALSAAAHRDASAQTFAYRVSGRVDTANADVRAVLETWIGYLGAKPDSAYDNPYWNQREKAMYQFEDFDLAGHHLFFQIPADVLLRAYKPTVLSIERVEDHFEIRTLFYGENLPAEMERSNPLTILRVAAVREGSGWKLANMLPFETSTWLEQTVGPITYLLPPEHSFNEALAKEAARFVDSVGQLFGRQPRPFRYYVGSSVDKVGTLVGHDFFFVGMTSGLALPDNRILLAGTGSEHYPHELVHMVLGEVASGMLSEGIATWIGGAGGRTFLENVVQLRRCLESEPGITFEQIIRREWGWHCNAYYTTGAVIAELVHSRGGTPALRRLLDAPEEEGLFLEFVADALGVSRDRLSGHVLEAIARGLRP